MICTIFQTPFKTQLALVATRFATAIVALSLFGLSASNAADLRIGMVAPISGPLAKLGQETVIGSQIAVDIINEQGGVNGQKVVLTVADTPTPDLAKSEVERLVLNEKIKAIVGNYGSSLAIASSTTAVRHGAFYWEQSSSSYDITRKADPYAVKTTWGNFELIQTLENVVKNVIAPRLNKPANEVRIALLHEDSGWGSELAQLMQEVIKSNRLKVVFIQGYNAARTSDFTPMILRMKQETPDVVVAASYLTDAVKFQQQSKEQNFNVKAMIGFTAGYGISDFASTLGKNANDILVIDSNPEINIKSMNAEAQKLNREFINRFTKQTGKPPASHALYAFLGSYTFFKHVLPKSTSMEPDAILKSAMSLDLPFGSLPMGFGIQFSKPTDERPRYNQRGLTILNQWRDGKLVAVYPNEHATEQIRNIPLPAWSQR